MKQFDVIIAGAGAAGLMCAIAAGKRGRRVLVLDHAAGAGAKIIISGGGRCNFTNIDTHPDRFLSGNPHFCKSALARFTPRDIIAMVETHRIAWHEKKLGQLFCDNGARQIVDMLLTECATAGATLRFGQKLQAVTKSDGGFVVETASGPIGGASFVLATGGLSIPKLGASPFAHRIATRFGLKLADIRPGLVPLVANAADLAWMAPLAGVSLPAVVAIGKRRFAENILFTHRGLSGPAILQISSYWHPGDMIQIDMLPGQPADFLLALKAARPQAELRTILGEHVPARLAAALTDSRFPNAPLHNLTDKTLLAIGARLKGWPFLPADTEGYAKAEVTVGGIDTEGLSSKTMEARAVPGLYAIGEAVDVTGWLGGYNFQWAWASGWCAGQAA